jgi:uncharacterized FlgJ-related protein
MELRNALNEHIRQVRQRVEDDRDFSIQVQRKETLGMLDEHEKQRVKELCERIAKEQDHNQFSTLIAQLNQLLEQSELRSHAARNNLSHFPKRPSRPNI